jgi:hypothetical protein
MLSHHHAEPTLDAEAVLERIDIVRRDSQKQLALRVSLFKGV